MKQIVLYLHLLVPGAASFGTLSLHTHVVYSGPRSRAYSLLSPNGSSIPADGAVWPTGIYWTTVQVEVPPVGFHVCPGTVQQQNVATQSRLDT